MRLSAAITKDDARAIDVKYHLSCWVQNVQRGAPSSNEDKEYTQEEANVGKVASDIEFVSLAHTLLQSGEVLNMTDLKSAYSSMLESNGVHIKPSTRDIKEKITSHIDGVHFMKPKRRNESDRVFTTAVRDAAMEDAMSKSTEGDIRKLFESASILRAAITAQNKHPWEFKGELSKDDAEQNVPKALYAFIRWLVAGPAASIEAETVRSESIHRDVLAISQNIMYCCKSKRQVVYKPKQPDAPFRHQLEWPQPLAVGIAVHQSTRSKKLLEFLHGFGLSVDYSRILRLETQLANAVIEETEKQGAYLPATMRKGSFIFFAIDNSDFNEDTPDGKRTLHATATALYQRKESSADPQSTRKLRLHDQKARDRSLKNLTDPDFIRCHAPNIQGAKGTRFTGFQPGASLEAIEPYSIHDLVWLLSRAIMRSTEVGDVHAMDVTTPDSQQQDAPQDIQAMDILPPDDQLVPADLQVLGINQHIDNQATGGAEHSAAAAVLDGSRGTQDPEQPAPQQGGGVKYHNIPTWAAYNSLLSSQKPLTEVSALPLIAAPAHEWQTLITVLKQTQQINCMVMGPDRKTVITLDMALYERAKQLEMTRDDCKGKWVLRLGEMHTVMAALRAAGNAIEDSGLEEAWSEADIYGPTTTRQILEARHMKRALEAHMTTVQVLYDLYVEEFFLDHPELKGPCVEAAQQLDRSCVHHLQQEMLKEQQGMLGVFDSHRVLKMMAEFDKKKEAQSQLFTFVRIYMKMVLLIYTFIRATCDGLWELHLSSLDALCKYFFAYDNQKYARLVPLYLAEMATLRDTDPNIHQEFMDGNFAVNKNQIPFCAIGVDHALEHINRIMKVTGGLVGITQNASARDRFFLTAPELSRLAEEAHVMAGTLTATRKEHHDLTPAIWTRQEENIARLKSVVRSSINPIKYEGEDLINIITKVVMPAEVAKDVCNQDNIGQQAYAKFVEERINTNEVNAWAKMKKVQLRMWKSARKSVKYKVTDQVVELKDERSLFARMLIVARSRPEINLKEGIGHHEFTSLPRALLTASGELLPSTDKSKLMGILEELANKSGVDWQPEDVTNGTVRVPPRKVTVIDGMAVVQAMGKPTWVKTCAQWAEHFTTTLDRKCSDYDEVHLVFDRYNLPTSLKEATRETSGWQASHCLSCCRQHTSR